MRLTPSTGIWIADSAINMSQADLSHEAVDLSVSVSLRLQGLTTYVELPGETRKARLAVDEWQNLVGQLVRLLDDDDLACIVPPYDLASAKFHRVPVL
jgi:hypothetical protein